MGKKVFSTAILGAGSAVAAGLMVSGRMEVGYHTISTPKLNRAVRMAVVADLHGKMNGSNPEELFQKIQNQTPDAILLPGDIVDDKRPNDFAYSLLDKLGKNFACYYVTGNHELRRPDSEQVKEEIRRRGITVLEGETKRLNIFGQQLEFSGADSQEIGMAEWREQLQRCEKARTPERFSVHLCHRPNYPSGSKRRALIWWCPATPTEARPGSPAPRSASLRPSRDCFPSIPVVCISWEIPPWRSLGACVREAGPDSLTPRN